MDPWVPGLKVSPKAGMDMNMCVADLINDQGVWVDAQLADIGTVQEVDTILQISVVRSSSRDRLLWNYNHHRRYSVESGYWLASKKRRTGNRVMNPAPEVTKY